jgi:O-methyltransferase involved in polyketide biosynthesis
MPENSDLDLGGAAETLLITLYMRALESQRPGGLINDEKAVALVTQRSSDFDCIRRFPMSDLNIASVVLRSLDFDRRARDFLASHPHAVVVHIGCGFDTRFERVDDGQVEWYDLDLPDVISLRRKFIGDEGERYHLLGCSVLDEAWLETVSVHKGRPFMFIAEGVFMYLEGVQVKGLVLALLERFPGAELVYDAFSPLHVWNHSRLAAKVQLGSPLHWGIWRGQEVERWGDGIRLLDEVGWLDWPEPRLAPLSRLRGIPFIGRIMRTYHFQLGRIVEGAG